MLHIHRLCILSSVGKKRCVVIESLHVWHCKLYCKNDEVMTGVEGSQQSRGYLEAERLFERKEVLGSSDSRRLGGRDMEEMPECGSPNYEGTSF